MAKKMKSTDRVVAIKQKINNVIQSTSFLNGSVEIDEQFFVSVQDLFKVLEKDSVKFGGLNELGLFRIILAEMEAFTPASTNGQLTKLSQEHTAKDQRILASNIFKSLNLLPKSYYVYFPIQHRHKVHKTTLTISDTIALVYVKSMKVNKTNSTTGSLSQALGLVTSKSSGLLPGLYVRIQVKGYITDLADTRTVTEATGKFKQFASLSMLEDRLEITTQSSRRSIVPKVYFCDLKDKKRIRSFHVSESFNTLMAKLEITWEFPNPKAKKSSKVSAAQILGFTSYTKLLSDRSSKLLSSNSNNELASFKNALEWGFDSQANSNDITLSFIQLSIALEAVLGEDTDPEQSLTKQLADRCAYLTGKGSTNRQQIRKDFIEFYKVRSKLVHGRTSKLEDKKFLHKGQSFFNAIMKKEIYQLPLS